jgi:carbonic anhydrase
MERLLLTEYLNMKSTQQLTPDSALNRLFDGNKRFASGLRSIDSLASSQRREQLARYGQNPFAIVLTCSDSRVPAETVFDSGLGDLFVIRVAGNIAAPSLIASIEFAALSFGSPLCVVMGHTQCGAIQGAVTGVMKKQNSLTGNLDILLKEIEPAAIQALGAMSHVSKDHEQVGSLDNVVSHAIELNVQRTMKQLLSSSPHLSELTANGNFKIVGAVYDISTGNVRLLDHGAKKRESTSVDNFRIQDSIL